MPKDFFLELANETQALRESGLFKAERIIESRQGASVRSTGRQVINLCSNNYLGLAADPRLAVTKRNRFRVLA